MDINNSVAKNADGMTGGNADFNDEELESEMTAAMEQSAILRNEVAKG